MTKTKTRTRTTTRTTGINVTMRRGKLAGRAIIEMTVHRPEVREYFDHDTCCGKPSVPVEGVPDQALRGCVECDSTWVEDLDRGPIARVEGKRIKTVKVADCGCCGGLHRTDFDGDCRDDSERFGDLEDARVKLGGNVKVEQVW